MRVIVIGAGVAGLAAADAARCAGADVTVLEARDRLGGRTWTVPFGSGWIDLGGAWIHGRAGNPVAEAHAVAGITTRNHGPYYSRVAVWADGWVDAPDATALASALDADWDPAEALAALPDSDRLIDGVEWFLADRELDGRAGELARFGLQWVDGALEFAAPPDRISLAGAAAFEWGSGGNLLPAGGYRMLVDRLSAGLDVRLSTAATAIEHGGDGVAVSSEGETFEGDRAVVTASLGTLRSGELRFDPPLGAGHAGAVERLGMGTLEKIVLRFPERFWPRSVRSIIHAAEDRSFPAWFDFSRDVGAPTLVAFYNPAVTPALAELTAERRVGPALAVLRKMFGPVPDPGETLVTDWTRDPWALGSYSYVPIGATVEDIRRLAEPASDRLVLAGEATDPQYYSTVHGAFCSGLRAAGLALGREPDQLSLGPVPPHWLASSEAGV